MSVNAIVWWVILVALVVVLALAGAQAGRALRELNRVKARTAGYGELPVMRALAHVELDVRRIEGAAAEIAPLLERVQVALAIIRRGPIPPELIAAVRGLRASVVALRTFASR